MCIRYIGCIYEDAAFLLGDEYIALALCSG